MLNPFDSASLLSLNNPKFSSTALLPPFRSISALFLSSSLQTQDVRLKFKTSHDGLSLLCVSALKGKRRNGGAEVEETDAFDDFEDEDDDVDDEDFFEDVGDDGDEDEYDDEEMFLPFGRMKRWLENKPRGFGEGEVYDTSIEDKLLEEIEQSKLKNGPFKAVPKNEIEKKNAPADIPSGICVRLFNLPKKKNIHRDLKCAFEGVPGIINIIPAVSGNKKTKDPICKGFAFVDFRSEEYATRFVQLFSRQSITFGKIQKQIRCEMMNSSFPKSVDEHSEEEINSDPKLTVTGTEEDLDAVFEEDENLFGPEMEVAADWSDPDNELDSEKLEEVRENLEFLSVSELNGADSTKQAKKSVTDSFSSNRQKKIQALKKKLIVEGKVKKFPKLDIPGSAKRLKVKEKAVLTDVFSKYLRKAVSVSKGES